ncbi:MAG: T9SS type A sorting domain-containing protein [Bacteroidota bacterium]
MRTNNYPLRIPRMILVAYFTLVLQTVGMAQPYAIDANVSNLQPLAGENITITLDISDALDFYYGGVEVSYDSELLEFISVENTGLSEGGISNSGELSAGTTGASVSRTAPLSTPSAGTYMALNFQVKQTAYATTTSFTFSNQEIFDSEGNEIPTESINSISLNIRESIRDMDMTISQENTVTEGENFDVTGRLNATGVTDTSRIDTWVGVNDQDTDPAEWDESVWLEMDYTETDANDYLHYTKEIAYKRSLGTWYIALRSRLDEGDWVYGGTNGLWDEKESSNGILAIRQQDPHQYTLAEWNFDAETLTPSYSIPNNREAAIKLEGASFEGFSAGASGRAANSNRWHGGSDGSKYWWASLSTVGFTGIELFSKQYGSNTGPRDYRIEISTNGNTWEAVEGSDIIVGNNWTSGVLDTLFLHESIADQENAYIRWIMTTDTSVNNGDISTSGTNRLDEVLITGVNPTPQRVEVFPGDANRDSLVNADDVLAIGTFWLNRGPVPIYNSTDFAAREVEAWITPEATHADTRGDGQVDHRDLMPVGLHFGKKFTATKKLNAPPLSEIKIEPQKAGSVVSLTLASEMSEELRGISFSLSMSGIDPDQWEILNIQPLFCPESWQEKLLSFDIKKGHVFESAFVLKGTDDMARSDEFVRLNLKATEKWTDPLTIRVNRVTISNTNSSKRQIRFVNLLSTDIEDELHVYESKLLPNRPNPFQNHTIIPYELSVKTHVRLEILNIHGQVVATVVDKIKSSGNYTFRFKPLALPPGNYLYRLHTETGYSKCRKMIYLK